MATGSKKVILSALIGNTLITISKIVVFFISGSTALLAEAIHSGADTGNQLLLLLGFHLSQRPADELHQFGYGKERYFWALMVAVSMFVIGAVVSIYEGVHKFMEPQPVTGVGWIYLVLGLSFVFESYPWYVALKSVKRENPGFTVLQAVRGSKSPSVIVVFLEDTAALLGIIIAFSGVVLMQVTAISAFDGLASIGIGLLLACVAFSLTYEIKSLLLGEAVSKQNYQDIFHAAGETQGVKKVLKLRTMHLGPDDVLITLNIAFQDFLSTKEIEAVVDSIEKNIRKVLPGAKYISIEADTE